MDVTPIQFGAFLGKLYLLLRHSVMGFLGAGQKPWLMFAHSIINSKVIHCLSRIKVLRTLIYSTYDN